MFIFIYFTIIKKYKLIFAIIEEHFNLKINKTFHNKLSFLKTALNALTLFFSIKFDTNNYIFLFVLINIFFIIFKINKVILFYSFIIIF